MFNLDKLRYYASKYGISVKKKENILIFYNNINKFKFYYNQVYDEKVLIEKIKPFFCS